MTTALEGGQWSASRPGRTSPHGEKTRYPLYKRLGGPQCRSGRAENLASPGFDPRTVRLVVSRYTDWATGPTLKFNGSLQMAGGSGYSICYREKIFGDHSSVCEIWYDMIYDMIWYDMTWHDMTWHDMTRHDTIGYDTIRYDMILHDMTWHDMTYDIW